MITCSIGFLYILWVLLIFLNNRNHNLNVEEAAEMHVWLLIEWMYCCDIGSHSQELFFLKP